MHYSVMSLVLFKFLFQTAKFHKIVHILLLLNIETSCFKLAFLNLMKTELIKY